MKPPRLLLILLFAIAALALMPSCGTGEWPVTGSISYRDPQTGAKGGLTFTPGSAPVASVKVPIYDPQTGLMIGLADLHTSFPQVDAKSGK